MDLSAITAVRRDWAMRSKGPAAEAVLEHLVALEPDIASAGARSLAALFGTLSGPVAGCPVPRWDITSALIRQFHADELVGLGLLSALVPGLVHVGRALSWGLGGPWDDAQSFASDLIATAWTVLAAAGGTTLAYPERQVLDRVRCHLRDQRTTARRRDERTSSLSAPSDRYPGRNWTNAPTSDRDFEDRQPVPVLDSLAIALRRFDHSAVPAEDVRLVFAHRVLGYSLRELAEHSGEKAASLKYRSHRAEALMGVD